MSHSQPFSTNYNYYHHEKADDSSTVFDADTVMPDEVPSLPPPAMPPLTATATFTDYLYNNINESTSSTSIQEESPQSFTSVLLRRINSTRHHPAEPSTTTATATRIEEISTNQSSSSSSKKRTIITNRSSHSSRKKKRKSPRLNRQSQIPDQSCVDKPDSEVDDENEPDEAVINQSSSSSSSQTSTTKQQRHNELKWRNKFEELRVYKQLHGHTCVPRSNKQLGNWVNHQRTEYKKFKANKKAYITKQRIQTLESIGFEWELSEWNKRFNELKEYKELHGHTNVPQNFKDNKQLGTWVSKQRHYYKKFKANEKSQITPERIKMLESIGFEWELKVYSEWNERFNELKDYKEEYKNTNVPRSNKELGLWVMHQRQEYQKFKDNKHSCMTPERIQMLESIGFEWVSPIKGGFSRNESAWNERFNELKAYKEKYGRTDVPRSNKELGLWVSTQRAQYKKLKKTGKGWITRERIEMLESIGFEWECRPGRAPRS